MTDIPKIINRVPPIGWQLPISSEEKKFDSLEDGDVGKVQTTDAQGNSIWINPQGVTTYPSTKPPYKSLDKELDDYNKSQQSNLRMECLKIAQVLLADHLKDLSLSPRDNSLAILWEVSEKCFEYCTAAKPVIIE